MLDLNKPVQTIDGRPARIICTDRKCSNGRCIVALVWLTDKGDERCVYYDKKGNANGSTNLTLVNVESKVTLTDAIREIKMLEKACQLQIEEKKTALKEIECLRERYNL